MEQKTKDYSTDIVIVSEAEISESCASQMQCDCNCVDCGDCSCGNY